MRLVRLTSAMKTDTPFVIVGDKDATLRLTHAAAQFVVILGNGVYADDGEQPGPSRAELERQEAEIQASAAPEKTGEDDSQPGDDADAAEEVKRPYGNSPKSAWVRYACQVDDKMTEERAEGMTKADLMSRYGERLL